MKSSYYFRLSVLAFAFIIGLDGLDYSDLKAMNVSCPEFDSCAERSEIGLFGKRNCECDDLCITYNDCCIDKSRGSIEKGISHSEFSCDSVPFIWNSNLGEYFISRCQHNWEIPNKVRAKCEFLNDLDDPLMAIPATDTQRNVTYRNRYCAECNRAVQHELSSWEISYKCNTSTGDLDNFTSDELTYRYDLNKWGITKDNLYYTCDISFTLPVYLEENVRGCKRNVIGTCPPEWNDIKIKRMCDSYMALTETEHYTYRNPHCALCNEVGLDQMECARGGLPVKSGPLVGHLFDVNQSDGDTVGVKAPKEPSCPAGQTHDPFYKKCRKLDCGLPGFTMLNGVCVKS